ncbi:MAG: aminotransferase class I/II-fold pyridoxal phosphate-dependent enzyme [Deltaproteobacteria bacterium]|nr:aminotransferase class I/II-fold pyridoxal phosphate-dependent enzyme [Deltaproteobacteria bacterium]
MDVFQKCRDYTRAESLRDAGVYHYFRRIASAQDPVVTIGGKSLIMLGSNNYLGLANHPEVKAAASRAVEQYGTGCAGSPLLNGTLELHAELEHRLASFMQRDAAVIFSTGFQVNLGVLSALLGRRDIVFLDNLDHACIIDGARLGLAKMVKYRHNDMADLAAKLARTSDENGRFIVVDGVFSMEGDLCHLPELVELKRRHDLRLMVDDAHGIGVLGQHGRGTVEHFGLESEVDLVMGTFSKSLAGVGGFVCGDRYVIDFIRHNARSQIFSASMPPASAAAVLKALEIVEREPERRQRLWENTRYMKQALDSLGYDTGEAASPVIPMVVGDDFTAYHMVADLHEEGVFANPVVSPAVPAGRAMIRTSYMATHTREHLDQALRALEVVGRRYGVIGAKAKRRA